MVGRAWVSVLLIATLTGCASRSRPKPFLPNMNIPLECATRIRLIDCDLSFRPPHLPGRCRHVSQGLRASNSGGQMRFLAGFFAGLSGRTGSSMHIIAGRCTGLACTSLLPCVTLCIILRPPIPSTSP